MTLIGGSAATGGLLLSNFSEKESGGKVHVVVLADTKDGPDPEEAKRILSDISEKIKKDTE